MAKETVNKETAVVTPKQEPTYEAAEIAANAPRLIGYSIDLATAALVFNRVERCTLDEAKTIIKKFSERKVK